MIQIRFHGRGGHGIKTASRILGTAAFLEGYEAQDSPLYGAERRGAPIVAFTRIAEEPIRMRGPVTHPDLVIVVDETLLVSGPAGPLSGINQETVVFVNTTKPCDALREQVPIPGGLITMDITNLVNDTLGSPRSLSGAIGGLSCRLFPRISKVKMQQAVQEELEILGLSEAAIKKNISLATTCFNDVPQPAWVKRSKSVEASQVNRIVSLHNHPATISAPSIYAHGNTTLRHTGNWRFERPEIDLSRCTKCGICILRCPDGAMALDEEGYPVIDYEQCKGCLICTTECPLHLITTEKELRSP